mmetsp:Transcript_16294/g.35685  ORF Transcript_16294/g.35685 Transcript_16294/m.35685 type:complete len:786 (+) Transcript_16294:71-2428(+)
MTWPLQRLSLLSLVAAAVVQATVEDDSSSIAPTEVEHAQQAWADALIDIAAHHRDPDLSGDGYKDLASKFVDTLYAYATHSVLFSVPEFPERQFRISAAGAVSYLIGGNAEFPEDDGFALRNWKSVRFENAGISQSGGEALAMGHYFFTDTDDAETKMEYSFGYIRDSEGALRINLHHWSMPFAGHNQSRDLGVTREEVEAAQESWAAELVEIGTYSSKGWAYRERGRQFIDTLYAYGISNVLFKPAEDWEPRFRSTSDAALAYFVASKDFPEDTGFALKPWTTVHFKNSAFILEGERAWAMGTYTFSNEGDEEYVAEYVFGYIRDSNGGLRINLHHSSFQRGGSQGVADWQVFSSISESDVVAAQRAWCHGFALIGAAHEAGNDYVAHAARFVDGLYAFAIHPVLFKPAEASEQPFRLTRDAAISYFIGGNQQFPEDGGFALQPWRSVRFSNMEVTVLGDEALAIGNIFFEAEGGVQTKASFTLGYVRDENGALRINLQHSSFPHEDFRGQTTFKPVTQGEVAEAQRAWGDGIVRIGELSQNRSLYAARAIRFVEDLYAFGERPVLFRATDTSDGHFRSTTEGALSYFIGRSTEHPSDEGFVLRPWKQVRFNNSGGLTLVGDRAHAMGVATFTDSQRSEMQVDYSIGYVRSADGALRIDLHFLSRPYFPEVTQPLLQAAESSSAIGSVVWWILIAVIVLVVLALCCLLVACGRVPWRPAPSSKGLEASPFQSRSGRGYMQSPAYSVLPKFAFNGGHHASAAHAHVSDLGFSPTDGAVHNLMYVS